MPVKPVIRSSKCSMAICWVFHDRLPIYIHPGCETDNHWTIVNTLRWLPLKSHCTINSIVVFYIALNSLVAISSINRSVVSPIRQVVHVCLHKINMQIHMYYVARMRYICSPINTRSKRLGSADFWWTLLFISGSWLPLSRHLVSRTPL